MQSLSMKQKINFINFKSRPMLILAERQKKKRKRKENVIITWPRVNMIKLPVKAYSAQPSPLAQVDIFQKDQ